MRNGYHLMPMRRGRLIAMSLLLAGASMTVNAQITLKVPQTNLETVIKKIQRQYHYQFVYDRGLSSTKVNAVNVNNGSMTTVLNNLLKGKGISFVVDNKVIYLKKEEAEANAGTKQQTQPSESKKVFKGRVIDNTKEGVIGATVKVAGTNIATITDMDGNFSIEAPANATLEISYIGFEDQNVKARNGMTVALQETSKELNEVVVTALGIKREQKALSYNVQQVNGDDLTMNKDANFINSLTGKVAGVNINASSSGAGGASKVVLRGSRSIMQSSNVLYVIDGIPMLNTGGEGGTEFSSSGTSEGIADLNSEDIESMSVLTGAAAAALYGEKASNGAIVITTKKGKAGHTEFTVTQSTQFSSAFVMPQFQNKYGTGSSIRDAGADSYSWGRLLNDANYQGYDPESDYLKRGVMTTEGFTLSTGTEKNQSFLSASALNSGGIIPSNSYNRYNFTFRNTTSLLNDRMTIDAGASYIIQNDRNMTNQGVYANPLVTAYLYPRGNSIDELQQYERYDTSRKIYVQNWNDLINELVGQNPYWINYRNPRTNKKYRYMINAGVNYKFTDWLNVGARIRIDNSNNTYEEKYYATTNTTLTGSANGSYQTYKTNDKQVYGDVMANINKRWLEDRLSLVANVGVSLQDVKESRLGARGPIDEDLLPNVFNVFQLNRSRLTPIQDGYHEQTKSLFASAEIGWDSQYYLTLTGRNDWPSMLAGPHSNKKSFFYPSVGLSWIVSQTIKMPKAIDYLKVRGSFASVGLSFPREIANPLYEWDETNKQWKNQTTYPMYDLKPERTDSWEVGLQTRFLKHFNLDFTYYYTKTFNQTFNPKISVSSGYSTMYLQTGSVRNQGIELAFGYSNKWGNFGWSSNYTFSMNRNKILELVDNYVHPETGAIISVDKLDEGGLGSAHFILKKGGTLGDLYSLVDIQRDSNGKVYVDANGKVYTNTNVDEIKLGSIFPKSNMAWRNDFTWRGFNLGVLFTARFGGIVYSATQANLDKYGVSESTADARDMGYVSVNRGENYLNPEVWFSTIGNNDGIPQFYTYSATNIRLQELSFGYTFKKNELFGIGDLTLSFIARNLWMLYCKAPFDPETTASTGNYYQGIDKFMTPSTRTLGFNIKLKF